MTALAAPAANGKAITIKNAGTGNMYVVLVDSVNATGTEAASVKPFSLGGADVWLAPGDTRVVTYSVATGRWS